MSIIRNRELSQFGSFIYIDNNNGNIGIATTQTPYIGIGTPDPSYKLHVVGDTNIDGDIIVNNGNVEASSFTLNGVPLVAGEVGPAYGYGQWEYATNQTDVYRLDGNIGIGTSVFTQKLTVVGNVSAGQFISTVTSGTAPLVVSSDTQVTNLNASFLRGKIAPSGTIVGTTDTQTLSNKTLSSPILTSPSVSSGLLSVNSSGISFSGSTSGTTTLIASAIASGTLTLPATTDTLVTRNFSETLTNKTISASNNTITGLTSSSLSSSANISNTQLQNSTISGVSLGSTLASLSFGGYITASGPYDGSVARTVSVAATTTNTGNTIVARDISGDFTAGTIYVTGLNATHSITALDFTATSDINFKTNIKTVENALDIISNIRGVSFDWKENGIKSYGVIAQELEEVLPELIKDGDIKSVNYNGLIPFLIEAIKDLKKEIEELKNLK